MPGFFIYNGKFHKSGETAIGVENRSFRYGDGLFETIRFQRGKIPLAQLHFERLFSGLATLKFDIPALFTPSFLEEKILVLCKKNKIQHSARIRINVFRGNGGVFDPENHNPNYVIECSELPGHYLQLNENGLDTDLFTDDRKSMGALANLKSNNYLIYVMAAISAKEKKINEVFVLNSENRIADSCIANVFWTNDNIIHTPPLSEGGVAGVMRKYLLAQLPAHGFQVMEKKLETDELLQADEVFLSNAVAGIRWVKQFQSALYSHSISAQLYKKIIEPLFS